MIRLNVLDLLEQRGHTKYWLYKQLGLSYKNFDNMIKGRTRAIRFQNLETLCQVLECTPNDLFVIDFDKPEG